MNAAQLSTTPTVEQQAAHVERLLTIEQCCAAASVSRPTLWRWRAECGLKSVTIGGVTRIRERDWLAFLERYTVAGSNGNGGAA